VHSLDKKASLYAGNSSMKNSWKAGQSSQYSLALRRNCLAALSLNKTSSALPGSASERDRVPVRPCSHTQESVSMPTGLSSSGSVALHKDSALKWTRVSLCTGRCGTLPSSASVSLSPNR
jgi:hypothetical protein